MVTNNYQDMLSEQLQLLHELSYSDPSLDIPYKGAGVYSRKDHDHNSNRDVRILDAIAVALTTGKQGDTFAAAFDKRQPIQLVLAKNGPPTPQDIEAANQLFSLIGDPAVQKAMDIFPERCGENMNKRICNLHTSLLAIHDDFTSELQTYAPKEIETEFPCAEVYLEEYDGALPPFSVVLQDLVDLIIENTVQGLKLEDVHSSKGRYANLFLYADSLSRSRFLDTLANSRNAARKERAERLKRRLYKVCQYISGITYLIQEAQRFLPIPHHWVTDNFTGTGEGEFNLCENVHDAVSRGLKQPLLSQEVVEQLDAILPYIQSNWSQHQTVHTCVHAELRIILHLGLPLPVPSPSSLVQPIGMSKRSCFCCTLWIAIHNDIFKTRWMTSGSHGKPYANWAFPGSACSYAIEDGKSSVDKAVLDAVAVRLEDTLDWLFPGEKRISDGRSSSKVEASDSEQQQQNQRDMNLVDRPRTVFRRRRWKDLRIEILGGVFLFANAALSLTRIT